jgi:hypothetical protein
VKRILAILGLIVGFAVSGHAQGGGIGNNDSTFINNVGHPIAGASVAVCQPLTTTAASVTSNLATFTMSSNPQTAGYAIGMTILVAGFTGGDTYFNAGSLSSNVIINGLTILATSPTTIVAALTHANGTASSNGTILQMGNASTSCAALSTVYSDPTDTVTTPNPFTTDSLGNWQVFGIPGTYYVQFYGSTLSAILRLVAAPCVPGASSSTCGGVLGGPNIWTGVQTFTGSNTFKSLDGWCVVGGAAGYATIELAVAACPAPSSIFVSDGFTESIATNVVLSGTPGIKVMVMPSAALTIATGGSITLTNNAVWDEPGGIINVTKTSGDAILLNGGWSRLTLGQLNYTGGAGTTNGIVFAGAQFSSAIVNQIKSFVGTNVLFGRTAQAQGTINNRLTAEFINGGASLVTFASGISGTDATPFDEGNRVYANLASVFTVAGVTFGDSGTLHDAEFNEYHGDVHDTSGGGIVPIIFNDGQFSTVDGSLFSTNSLVLATFNAAAKHNWLRSQNIGLSTNVNGAGLFQNDIVAGGIYQAESANTSTWTPIRLGNNAALQGYAADNATVAGIAHIGTDNFVHIGDSARAIYMDGSGAGVISGNYTHSGFEDFTAGTMELPEAAGFTANVNSTIGLDTTAFITHLWTNNADSNVAVTTSTSTTTTQPLFATATAGVYNPRGIATADIATALTTPSNIDGTIYADQQAGATGGAKLIACLTAAALTNNICDARNLTGTQTIPATVVIGLSQTVLLGSNLWTSAAAGGMFSFTSTSNFLTSQAGKLIQEPGGVLQYTNATSCISTPGDAAIVLSPGGAGNYINGYTIDIDTIDGNGTGSCGIQYAGAGWVQRGQLTFKHIWHFTIAGIDMQLGRKNGNTIKGGDIDGSNVAATASNATFGLDIEDSTSQAGYNLYEGNYLTINNLRNCLKHISMAVQTSHNYLVVDSNFDYVTQANTASSVTISNVPNPTNFAIGDQIWDSGGAITAGTTVSNIVTSTYTLSAAATGTVTADNFYDPKYFLMDLKGSHNSITITGLNPWFNYTAPGTPVAGVQPFLPSLYFDTSLYASDNIINIPPQFIAGMMYLPKTQGANAVPFDNELVTAPIEKNLLINGGFEDQNGTYPTSWTSTQMSSAADTVTTLVHGNHAANFVANANTTSYASQALPAIVSGKTVIGCAWVRWNAGTAGQVGISLFDNTGETFMSLPPNAAVGNGDAGNFYYMCVSRTMSTSVWAFRIYAQHNAPGGCGGACAANTIYADGAGVYMGATPVLPSDVVADTGTLTSSSTINWTEVSTLPTGVAGLDVCNGYTVNHLIECSLNNGGVSPIALTGVQNVWAVPQLFNSGALISDGAGAADVGSTVNPFGNLWLGASGTSQFKFAPGATSAARVVSILDPGAATTLDLTSNTTTTTTQVLHGSATAGTGTWSAIAGADLPAVAVQTGQTNVYGAFLQDFTAGTMELPEAAGATTNVNSTIINDTTNNATHLWVNSADSLVAAEAAGITANVIPKSTDNTHGLITASSITDNGTKVTSTEMIVAGNGYSTFLTSGTSWTSPVNLQGTSQVKITLVGGGNAGGTSGAASIGTAGGAGCTDIFEGTATTLGLAANTAYTIAIGSATGGSTTFNNGTITVTAAGGAAGATLSTAAIGVALGATGGTCTNGTILTPGQSGLPSEVFVITTTYQTGTGGSTIFGSGGAPVITGVVGNPGTGYGSGGSGGGIGTQAGGAGKGGAILIEITL